MRGSSPGSLGGSLRGNVQSLRLLQDVLFVSMPDSKPRIPRMSGGVAFPTSPGGLPTAPSMQPISSESTSRPSQPILQMAPLGSASGASQSHPSEMVASRCSRMAHHPATVPSAIILKPSLICAQTHTCGSSGCCEVARTSFSDVPHRTSSNESWLHRL